MTPTPPTIYDKKIRTNIWNQINNNIDGWVVSVRLDKPKKSSGGLLRLGLPIDTRLIYEWVRCHFFS